MSKRSTTIHSKDSAPRQRGLFGRRQGRALKGERLEAYNTVLPKIQISKEILNQDGQTAPQSLFDKPFTQFWLEIGFGHGERLAQDFKQKPDTGFLGAEPFMNGLADFLNTVKKDDLSNIRVIDDDGMIIAKSLKDQSLDRLYILNPDPWHKKRHHKRRIINQENLDIFARILKPGAPLILTTDVEDLANWMCTQTINHPAFTWLAKSKDDWENPPQNWISTRYEKKGAKGTKKMVYLIFHRKHLH